MILVFGASGKVGGGVARRLAGLGEPVRAFVRDPTRASFGSGVEVFQGDLMDTESVAHAMVDVDSVFMVSAGSDALRQDRNVAAAVRATGVSRVVRLSSVAAIPPVDNSYGAAHVAAERAFLDSGTVCVMLRAAAFTSNALEWAGSIRSEGRVYQPYGKIPQAVVDPADLAKVATCTLLRPGYEGQAPVVTGPAALTGAQRAARIADALGRPIEFVDAPPELARKAMTGLGLPPDYVDGLLAAQADPDPARGGTPLSTVEDVTGHPAGDFDGWLSRNLAAFTG